MYVFVLVLQSDDNFYFILLPSNASTKGRNWYTHHKKIIISSSSPRCGDNFLLIAPTTRHMYQVVHRSCAHPHLDSPQHKCGGRRSYYSDGPHIKQLVIFNIFNYFQYFNLFIVINCKQYYSQ